MTWPIKKLGAVTKIEGGGTPSTKNPLFWNGDVPWLTPKELSDFSDSEISDTERKITKEGLSRSSTKLLPAGTVLFTSRAPIGYIVIAGIEMATNQGFKNFICNEKILYNRFLYYFLKLRTKYLQSLGRGATFTEISKSILAKVDIPIPPLAIQKRIVERMDKIAEARKLNDDLIQKSDELFQSLLYSLVRANSGITKKLGDKDIIEIIDGDRGKNYPPKNEFQKSGYCLFLNTKNVTQTGFIFNEIDFISKERDEKLRKGKLQRNDVVLTTRGTVGNSALYDASVEFNHIRINSGMVVLRPSIKEIIPKFLSIVISSRPVLRQFKQILSGTAQPQLPITNLVKIKFPLPPLKIQKQIVAKLSAVREYKKQLLEQKSKSKELFDSVLHKSMNGGFGN